MAHKNIVFVASLWDLGKNEAIFNFYRYLLPNETVPKG